MHADTDIEAAEAVLAWNVGIGGASVAVPVERLSTAGAERFEGFGFDEDLGSEGLGYLRMSDGRRLVLTTIAPDAVREALECDVAVVLEVERSGDNATREYPVDVAPAAPAPRM